MTDTPTSLAAELAALRAKLDTHLSAADVSLEAATKALAAADGVSADVARLAARLEALPVGGTATPATGAPAFPGDPGPGRIRWGAGIGGNADPVARHESAAGVPMGVRRTYWSMAKAASLIATAKADIAAGRVPWVSVKLGVTWAEFAAGKLDAAFLDLLAKLGALPGPVWLTVHHEPEGGNGTPYPDDGQGSEVHWRAMQAHVRTLLDRSKVTNIAFAPVLMSWTFDPRSGRNPADWWVPEARWDFAGIDHYIDKETVTSVADSQMWAPTVAFYKAKGLRIALGEWGNRGTDAAAAAEMTAFYDHLLSIGSPGAAYFDSSLNSPSGSWELVGGPLNEFRRLMKLPTSATLSRA